MSNSSNKISSKRLATVLYDYDAQSSNEIQAQTGEVVCILDDISDVDWVLVEHLKPPCLIGYIPREYINELIVVQQQQRPPVPTRRKDTVKTLERVINERKKMRDETLLATTNSLSQPSLTQQNDEMNNNNNNNNDSNSRNRENEVLEQDRTKNGEQAASGTDAGGPSFFTHKSLSSQSNSSTITTPKENRIATKVIPPPLPARKNSYDNANHSTFDTTTTASSSTGNSNGVMGPPLKNTNVSSTVNSNNNSTNNNNNKDFVLANDTGRSKVAELRKSFLISMQQHQQSQLERKDSGGKAGFNPNSKFSGIATSLESRKQLFMQAPQQQSPPTTVSSPNGNPPSTSSMFEKKSNGSHSPREGSDHSSKASKIAKLFKKGSSGSIGSQNAITPQSDNANSAVDNQLMSSSPPPPIPSPLNKPALHVSPPSVTTNTSQEIITEDNIPSHARKASTRVAVLSERLSGLVFPSSNMSRSIPVSPEAPNKKQFPSNSALSQQDQPPKVSPFIASDFTQPMNSSELQAWSTIENSIFVYLKRRRLQSYLQRDASLKDARMRLNVVTEIYTTECTYVNSLQLVKERFLTPITEKKLLKSDEISVLFGSMEQVLNVHMELLNSMEVELSKSRASNNTTMEAPMVGKVIARIAPFLKLYTDYVNNFDAANDLYEKLYAKHRKFCSFVDKATPDMGLPLPGYLIQPIQRIPRIKMLLDDLMKRTPTDHIDYPHIEKAFNAIQQIATFINEHKRQNDHSKELLQIQSRLDPQILLPHRRCIFAGSVVATIETSSRLHLNTGTGKMQGSSPLTTNGSSSNHMYETASNRERLVVMRQKQMFKCFLFNDLCILVDDPHSSVDSRYNSEDDGVYLMYLLFSQVHDVNNLLRPQEQDHEANGDMNKSSGLSPPPASSNNGCFIVSSIFRGETVQVTFYSTTSSIGYKIPGGDKGVGLVSQDHIQLMEQIISQIDQTKKHQVLNNRQQSQVISTDREWSELCHSYLELKDVVPRTGKELNQVRIKKSQVTKMVFELENSIRDLQKQIEDLTKLLHEQQSMVKQRTEDVESLRTYEEYMTEEYSALTTEKDRSDAIIQNALNRDSYALRVCFRKFGEP